MFLIFRGVPVLILAPFAAFIVMAFSGENFIEGLTGPFMTSMANFIRSNFLVFMFSSMFGKMMGDCGAANRIAVNIAKMAEKSTKNKAVLGVFALIIIYTILCYGGVSGYVIVFTVMPIAKGFFEKLDIPWHFYTCCGFGSGVLTLTTLPGTPSIHNIMPTTYYRTTTMAAPVLSLIASAIATALCIFYVIYAVGKAKRKGEGFLPTGEEINKYMGTYEAIHTDKPFIVCLIPSIVLLVLMNVIGIHAVASLIAALIVNYIIFYKELGKPWKSLNEGGVNAMTAMLNVSIVVGFGGVVSSAIGYSTILDALQSMGGPALFQVVVATNIASGVTGSAAGGLGITLENLSDRFMATGINPEVLHRITSMSCGGLDSLPTSGTSINTIAVTRLTQKAAYRHTFWLTVVTPLITTIIACFLANMGIV